MYVYIYPSAVFAVCNTILIKENVLADYADFGIGNWRFCNGVVVATRSKMHRCSKQQNDLANYAKMQMLPTMPPCMQHTWVEQCRAVFVS
jgi:hypothetical protein